MKNLTYIDLLVMIQKMPPERREDNVSLCVELGGGDEFLPVAAYEVADENTDTLDAGYYYLVAAV
jgi:hypothetical protein